MYWTYTPHLLPLMISGIACLLLWGHLLRRRAVDGAAAFRLSTLLLGLWSLANVMELGCTQLSDKLFWVRVQYVSVVGVPVMGFIFSLQYTSRGRWPTRRQMALLFVVPLVTLGLVLLEPHHTLTRYDFWLDESGPFSVIRQARGPWIWVQAGYAYLALTGMVVFLLRYMRRSPELYRGQILPLLIAIIPPWAGNIFYIFDAQTAVRLDLTPVAFTATAIFMALALFRHGLLDMVPIARAAVVENMAEALVVLDLQGYVIDLNPAAARLFSCPASDAIGRHLSDIPVLDVEVFGRLQHQMTVEEEVALEWQGMPRVFIVRAQPLYGKKGRLSGRMILITDITGRRRVEERLRHAQKLEAIGQLAGGIAHEFNNLLMVINGYSRYISDAVDPDGPVYHDAEAIRRAGLRAAELTAQLLAFSRQQDLQIQAVDVDVVVRDLVRILERFIGEDVTIELELADGIKMVQADPTCIEQVMINLATNARDAMPTGGVLTIGAAHVDLDESRASDLGVAAGPYVALSVRDTGCGMPPEVRQHIFEPFFTTKGVGQGTGLGLAMVHGIVRQSNGAVEVDMTPQQGSRFTVYLPCAQDLPDRVETQADEELPGGTETILLVEDQEQVLSVAGRMLRQWGYTVIECAGGVEAMEILNRHPEPVHLLLTDVVMPEMSGPDLVEAATRQQPDMAVLYMTGYDRNIISRHGVGAQEALQTLNKPFAPAELAVTVRQTLDTHYERVSARNGE